jgi:energy-coupling factor transporter ATP-binding protein EcfA2
MIRELTIKNYKSILDHTIELGRINVFIGENGCGKTNILEAVAMAAGALTDKLSVEELFNRGMRVARPSIMRSSFPGALDQEIVIECVLQSLELDAPVREKIRVAAEEGPVAEVKWFEKRDDGGNEDLDRLIRGLIVQSLPNPSPEVVDDILRLVKTNETSRGRALRDTLWRQLGAERGRGLLDLLVGDFAIYNANALALRGLETVSRRSPLGIHGETLDVAIAGLKPDVWADLLERAKCVSWLEDIVVDPTDHLKYQGHKLGKSQSTLYFHDKHMPAANNVFSAENVNEGVLHVLFHLTLFVSEGTPKVLGIDNVDTALNPQLCRDMMTQICELAAKHDKQALITTHNPATLDGLNLHDDEQRLFVVYRNDEGHTVTKRIRAKPQGEGQKLKLSELWMRGHLGGIPRNF